MKMLFTVFCLGTLLACEYSTKKLPEIPEKWAESQVAANFINSYVEACNNLENSEQWINENEQLSAGFKAAYRKLVKDAEEADPELGLDFDPIFNAQDYSEKGYKIRSFDSKTGMVYLEGIEYPDYQATVRLKMIGGKYLVDGAGVIRMVEK